MKKLFLLVLLFLALSVKSAYAHGYPPIVINYTEINQQEHNAFDYGTYLNGILWETKNTEWGVLGTYLQESSETRVMLGGKIYFNRLLYQKKQ